MDRVLFIFYFLRVNNMKIFTFVRVFCFDSFFRSRVIQSSIDFFIGLRLFQCFRQGENYRVQVLGFTSFIWRVGRFWGGWRVFFRFFLDFEKFVGYCFYSQFYLLGDSQSIRRDGRFLVGFCERFLEVLFSYRETFQKL